MIPTMCRASRLVILAGTMLAMGGCFGHRFQRNQQLSLEHVPGRPLTVTTYNGSVKVQRADVADKVTIDATLFSSSKERLEEAQLVAQREEDGTLQVLTTWPGGERKRNEGARFQITIPDVSDMRVSSSNGSINVSDFSGPLNITTSNGSVTVSNHDGPVNAHTSNGRATARNIRGPVELNTSNGSLKLNNVTGPILAGTSNGSIDLALPSEFHGRLSLRTSNGSIRSSLPNAASLEQGRNHLLLDLGGEGESRAHTSNGGVRVRPLP